LRDCARSAADGTRSLRSRASKPWWRWLRHLQAPIRVHALVGLLRQSVFGRLAGYEDVNDAERLRHDPAMRWIVGGKAAHGSAASPSQMGRFETQWLTAPKNLAALADLSRQWIELAPAIIRCSCLISSAIWNAALCVPATCTARAAGRKCSTRSWRLPGQGLAHLFPRRRGLR
jgi:Transposase DDE domain group 1